ncbi:EF-hand domain-containing protein [Nitratireductor basaltis]|uniref:Acid-shock protein n=1 Tax=Nitratireductor basaltis TaxID=472175 RepID=A0A084U9Y4_9HYPH|nr:EF-hand domain-containing protein [Nitratireductor basaltis]KFB09770.1 Acid-shock protein [Nitratireductor basaltis]
MFRKIILSALALSLLAGTAAVHAQDNSPATPEASSSREAGATPRQGRMLQRLDTNNDGQVSAEEFAARHTGRLSEVDANGDGELSKEELADHLMRRAFERRAERLAKRLDINGDDTVTLEEIEGHQAKRFALADRNDDGVLDQDELRKFAGERGMHKGKRHGGHMEHGEKGGREGMRHHMRKVHDGQDRKPVTPRAAPAE